VSHIFLALDIQVHIISLFPFPFSLFPYLQFRFDFTDNIFVKGVESMSGAINQSLFHNSSNESGNTVGAFKYQVDSLWSKEIFISGGDGDGGRDGGRGRGGGF